MSNSAATCDVLIAGGSFAGLATAVALADALGGEMQVVVADPASPDAPPAADARASALSAGSVRMLETLGVWPRLAAHAQPVTAIDITDSGLEAGIRPVLLSYDNRTADGAAATHIVENPRLLAALREAAAQAVGVARLNAGVASVTPGPGGAAVALSDGRTVRAALVVAADGRNSRLRQAAGIRSVGWRYAQTGIVTTVAHELPHLSRAVQHFLPAGPFAMLPLTGNRCCITWSEDSAAAARILALDEAHFLAEVEQRFGGKLGALSLAGPRQSWPLDMHLARSLIAERLALAGDAAHGVHPIAGQGLNLGLRDVAALTEVLAEAARLGQDLGAAIALERYQRWRRLDSAMSAATFDALNRLFANDWAVLRTARDAGLGVLDRLPALKRFLVAEAAGLTGEVPRLLRGERA